MFCFKHRHLLLQQSYDHNTASGGFNADHARCRLFPKMKRAVRIGIVADYDPKNKYHVATEESIAHAAAQLQVNADSVWLDTDTLDDFAAEARLAGCNGIWCGTSSPYRSMEGALRAIRFAREKGVPFVGT